MFWPLPYPGGRERAHTTSAGAGLQAVESEKPHEFSGFCDMVVAIEVRVGGDLTIRWIPVLICAGAIYLVFGGTFHANLMASPESTIVNLGRSVGEVIALVASKLSELIWS